MQIARIFSKYSLRLSFCSAVCLSSFVLLANCKPRASQQDTSASTEGVAIGKQYQWPSPNIGVCWENDPEQEKATINTPFSVGKYMADVEKYAKEGLKGSVVKLEGWKWCEKTEKSKTNLRLFIYDNPRNLTDKRLKEIKGLIKGSDPTHPEFNTENDAKRAKNAPGNPTARGTAFQVNQRLAGIILNMKIVEDASEKNLARIKEKLTNPATKAQQIYNLSVTAAMNSIGNSLGLKHEKVHPSSTCPKGDEILESGNSYVVNTYNPTSIMNICNIVEHYGDLLNFNDGDRDALNKIFNKTN